MLPVLGEVLVSIPLLEADVGIGPPPETGRVETRVLPPETMVLPCSLVMVVPPLMITIVDAEAGCPAGGD